MPFLPTLPADAGPPTIYNQFPDIYEPWSRMSEALMNGPSPLSQGERELILAFASGAAGCTFVQIAHAEVAYAWGIEKDLVEKLLADFDGTPLEPKLKTLLALVRKLAAEPQAVAQADVDAVLAAGWSEHALHDAVAVAARAAFMHRLIAAYGFIPITRADAQRKAQRRIEKGYVNLYPKFRAQP